MATVKILGSDHFSTRLTLGREDVVVSRKVTDLLRLDKLLKWQRYINKLALVVFRSGT